MQIVESAPSRCGLVVYISPKLASAGKPWCMAPICGEPSIKRLLERLALANDGVPHVLLHAPPCGAVRLDNEVESIARAAGAGFTVSRAVNILAALAEFTDSSGYDTLAVFPENAIFPDLDLTRFLLTSHWNTSADATWITATPAGTAPELYNVDALRRLRDLGLPQDVVVPPAVVMQESNRIANGNSELEFKLNRHDTSPKDCDCRYRVLVENAISREAAEQAFLSCEDRTGDEGARRFQGILATVEACERTEVLDLCTCERPRSSGGRRVLYSTLASALSGAEVSFSRLIMSAPSLGVFPVVAVPCESAFTNRLRLAGIHYEIPGCDASTLNLAAFAYFHTLLKEQRIDLVHIDSFGIPALVMAAVSSGIPVVQHVRVISTGRAPEIFSFASAFIAISDTVRRALVRTGVQEERVEVVYNGVELDFDESEPSAPIADGPVITMVARISRQKRPDLLLRALPDIQARAPNVTAIFAGEVMPPEFPYAVGLVNLVAELHLEDVVRFAGFVPGMTELYRGTTVLVLCTDEEPLGICLLEAARLGVTIIAPKSGGPAELFSHDEDALLFEPGNSGQLAECVIRALTDDELRERLSIRAVETSKQYSIERYTQGVYALYHKLLPACFNGQASSSRVA